MSCLDVPALRWRWYRKAANQAGGERIGAYVRQNRLVLRRITSLRANGLSFAMGRGDRIAANTSGQPLKKIAGKVAETQMLLANGIPAITVGARKMIPGDMTSSN